MPEQLQRVEYFCLPCLLCCRKGRLQEDLFAHNIKNSGLEASAVTEQQRCQELALLSGRSCEKAASQAG